MPISNGCRTKLAFFIPCIGYRAHIFDTKKVLLHKETLFFMQKMQNLNFVKTMLDMTTKIQHKLGFVITHCIVGWKSIYIEVYFWRETLQEISTGQIGYCAMVQVNVCLWPINRHWFRLTQAGSDWLRKLSYNTKALKAVLGLFSLVYFCRRACFLPFKLVCALVKIWVGNSGPSGPQFHATNIEEILNICAGLYVQSTEGNVM